MYLRIRDRAGIIHTNYRALGILSIVYESLEIYANVVKNAIDRCGGGSRRVRIIEPRLFTELGVIEYLFAITDGKRFIFAKRNPAPAPIVSLVSRRICVSINNNCYYLLWPSIIGALG